MVRLHVNPNSYDKIKEFQRFLRKRDIRIEAKALPNLTLEVENSDLEEVLKIAKVNKIYFD